MSIVKAAKLFKITKIEFTSSLLVNFYLQPTFFFYLKTNIIQKTKSGNKVHKETVILKHLHDAVGETVDGSHNFYILIFYLKRNTTTVTIYITSWIDFYF